MIEIMFSFSVVDYSKMKYSGSGAASGVGGSEYAKLGCTYS
jgi:hypothetical protein